jgi:hypothetical protein
MESKAPTKPPKEPIVAAELPRSATVDPDPLMEALVDIFGPELEELLHGVG